MIKQIAWNTFKNTGDIKTMLEILEMDKENAKENTELKRNNYGNYKDKRYSFKNTQHGW